MFDDKWMNEKENRNDDENSGTLERNETEGAKAELNETAASSDAKEETAPRNPEGQSQGANGYGQTAYGQTSQSPGGQHQGTNGYGQTAYGQTSQNPGGQSQGTNGYGQTAYGQTSQNPGSQSQGTNGYGQTAYGQPRPGYGPYPYGQQNQNRSQYTNPYPYGAGQNHGPYSNGGQNPNMNRNPKKKNSFMRTTAMVTAAALLFGVVAGGTMFGVNRAAETLFPANTQAAAETGSSLEQTPTVQATPQSSTTSSDGVVIEDVSAIVEAVMPSVVSITNTMLYRSNTWFGQTQTYEVPSSGSGIIVGQNDTELLIVTNNHVIEDSTSLSVTFIDESTVEAAVKGTDSESDLAVIAVPLENISADTKSQIKAATLGDSDELKMGQGVIAIGNALGLGQSVTVGHVSAVDREVTVDGVTKKVIQTDAAINPGNSGGALLNSRGEVIGINEAKYADESVEGIGYAIPINFAKDIIDDLMTRTTKIEVAEEEQGYLGIQVQNIDSATAKMYGMPEGVYVYKITEDSAAAESDLREKDIITKFDGETVKTNGDLTGLLAYYKAGTTVTLTVQSLENGSYVERQVEVTLKNRPQQDEQQKQ